MQVRYKKASKELLHMANPNSEKNLSTRSSINSLLEVSEHYTVPITKLIPYQSQPRKFFDNEEIQNLAISIKEYGIRQPLTIIASIYYKNKFEVISGERRLKAAKIIGLEKVPCIIISDHTLAEEIALIENIQRYDLHPLELGDAFQKILVEREDLSQIALSKKLGISHKLISEYLKFSKLPIDVKKVLLEKGITNRDFLRKLLKSSDPLKLINNDMKTKKTSKAILRISLVEENLRLQANAINLLSKDEKESLIIMLQQILEELKVK